jgi:Uma2 family endonuclease
MPLPSDPNPEKKFNYSDYLNWPDDQRWEIFEGTPCLLAPPFRIHQEIAGELFRQISNYLVGKPCKVYSAPFGVRLPKGTEANEAEIETVVEPDIAVICDQSKLDARGCKGAPDLIVNPDN